MMDSCTIQARMLCQVLIHPNKFMEWFSKITKTPI